MTNQANGVRNLNRLIRPIRRSLWETAPVAERYVTTKQAAAALGMASSTLRAAAVDGRLTPAHTTPGGHYRWDLDDLRRQLARIKGLSDD